MELGKKGINTLKKKKGSDMSSLVYGKIAPQAPQLEAAILGAIMLEPSALNEAIMILQVPDVFYSDANQRIFGAIVELYNKGSRIDFMVVSEYLSKKQELELVGGSYYVTNLTRDVVSSSNIIEHCRIVKEKYISREMIRLCGSIISDCYEDKEDVFDILDKATEDLISLNENLAKNRLRHIGEVSLAALEEMHEAKENPEKNKGIDSGIDAIGALRAPDVTVISAQPGEGKSTLALNIAKNVMDQDKGVLFFSLEMKAEQLMWKVFAQLTGKSINDIRDGKLDAADWKTLEEAQATFRHKKLFFHDVGMLDPISMRSIINAHRSKNDVDLVVLDYLQLMEPGPNTSYGNREQEVSKISRKVKQLAMMLDVPIIELVQMSRVQDGKVRLPKMKDLRESGAIENNADNIIFIFNPITYGVESVDHGGKKLFFGKNEVLIHKAKFRLGETGTKLVKFYGQSQTFTDRDVKDEFGNLYDKNDVKVGNAKTTVEPLPFEEPEDLNAEAEEDEAPF